MNSLSQTLDKNLYAYRGIPAAAVGVSGGADSLALLYLAAEWGQRHGVNISAMTVDHGLRPEAADEAAHVKNLCQTLNIPHVTLTAKVPLGDRRIQENARNMRYDLMRAYCRENSIGHLLLAHHLDDQYETVLMRLAHGSGLKGLGGIKPANLTEGILLLRPLLAIPKSALLDYCRRHDIRWCEDPSNQQSKYDRVRVRESAPVLQDLGLTPEMIEKSRGKLAAAQDFIDDVLAPLLYDFLQDGRAEMDMEHFLTLHPYMRQALIEKALKRLSGKIYPPRYDSLCALLDSLAQAGFSGATLHKCRIFIKNQRLCIEKEG